MVNLHALFVNENIGGHATMHRAIEDSLRGFPGVEAEFLHVPPPKVLRRLAAVSIPGLDRLDLDFQPLRYQLAQSAHIRREIQRRLGRVDVVHAYSQHAVLTCSKVLRRLPSVVSTDCTAEQNAYQLPHREPARFTQLNVRATRHFERKVFEAATLVVAQSEWAAASLRDSCDVEDDRLRVIPFGIFPFTVAERTVPKGPPQVTFVGSSMARKGGARLLRTFRERLAGDCVLNLVTRDEVDDQPGVRVFRDFEPGDSRLVELLARTALFALPSEVDKSPYSVLEAMVAGVPVVATRTGAIPEMVEDGVTGVLVDQDDAALADAIKALLDDDDRREAMGRAGCARVLERFDARKTTLQLVGVLDEARARFG